MTGELTRYLILGRSSCFKMLFLVFTLCLAVVCGSEHTLLGICPDVKLQENLDPSQFSGLWYSVASYASDGREIYDCSTIELQDNLGYMYKETYVQMDQGNRTQKMYQARVDPTFDSRKHSVFILSHELGEKVLQLPFFILATDYDGYAIAYTCKWRRKDKIAMHFVFTWVLTRNKGKLEGELLKTVEDKLSKYTDLVEHRQSFFFKDFSDSSCAYTNKLEVDFLTSVFW